MGRRFRDVPFDYADALGVLHGARKTEMGILVAASRYAIPVSKSRSEGPFNGQSDV